MKIIIRPANPADVETIVEFNAAMAYETESKILDLDKLTEGVRSAMAHPEYARYFVAEVNQEVVGQLMLTPEWSDWRNAFFWWIQSVYVPPEWRKKGVFSRLYQHVARFARTTPDVCGLRLYVEHENQTAQKTYLKMGMKKSGYDFFEVEF